MHQGRPLSPDQARYERAKAARASFIVSLAIGDQDLMLHALQDIEAAGRGTSMLWPEFLRWETTRGRE